MVKLNEILELLNRLIDEHFMASAPASLAVSIKLLLASGLEEIAQGIETGDARAHAELVTQLRACKPDASLEDSPVDVGEQVEVGVWVPDKRTHGFHVKREREDRVLMVPVLVTAFHGRPVKPFFGTWQEFLPLGRVILGRFAPLEARRRSVLEAAYAALGALGLDPAERGAGSADRSYSDRWRYCWVPAEIYAHPLVAKRPDTVQSELDIVVTHPDGQWTLWQP